MSPAIVDRRKTPARRRSVTVSVIVSSPLAWSAQRTGRQSRVDRSRRDRRRAVLGMVTSAAPPPTDPARRCCPRSRSRSEPSPSRHCRRRPAPDTAPAARFPVTPGPGPGAFWSRTKVHWPFVCSVQRAVGRGREPISVQVSALPSASVAVSSPRRRRRVRRGLVLDHRANLRQARDHGNVVHRGHDHVEAGRVRRAHRSVTVTVAASVPA